MQDRVPAQAASGQTQNSGRIRALAGLPPNNRREATAASMSVRCRFCCRSRSRHAANRDSILLTRISARASHDGAAEERTSAAFLPVCLTVLRATSALRPFLDQQPGDLISLCDRTG
jgi:hypothetical protein